MSDWVPDGWDEPSHEPDVVERAGLAIRGVAKIADLMVFSMVFSTVVFVFGGFASRGPSGPAVSIVAVAAWFALVIGFETATGWTPGKGIVGLRVRRAGGAGPPVFVEALVRNSVYAVGLLPIVGRFVGIPALLALVWTIQRDPDARGFHDQIAGTVVERIVPPHLR